MPDPGSILNPATYEFPIITETVEGAWADIVIRGDPALEPACIAAAKSLVERGAIVVSADYGFFIRHQGAVAVAIKVHVALSSLLLVPTLLRELPGAAKLAVVTADSTNCGEDWVDYPADLGRVVIGGIEGGKLLRNELVRPPIPTEVADIEKEVSACISRLRAAHPAIAAILFECTAFPVVTPAITVAQGCPSTTSRNYVD
ncbi:MULTISPECIES: hypothetical protein [unclassified Mesorhizobium]|uniref:hypothetical protein n=1 Tax=unclassified Mesorhizobium TaxID=325217 RepID=UPI001FE1BBAB|nr:MULTISPECIES: hypothetical protein [unclassified Mesorhizobium]